MPKRVSLPTLVLSSFAVVVIAFAGWMLARPVPSRAPANAAAPSAPPQGEVAAAVIVPGESAQPVAAASAAATGSRVIAIALVNGRVSGADETLKVRQGEQLELTFASDRPITLHLHGYDIEKSAKPNAPARMAFKASLPGRFPVSEHSHGAGQHSAVLYLEVHP